MGKNLKGKERSVQPKVLQQLLGHASVTDESLVNAIRQFQQATPPVTKKGVKRAYKKSKERRKAL